MSGGSAVAGATSVGGTTLNGASASSGSTLEDLNFDNRTIRKVPLDLEKHQGSVKKIPGASFSVVSPTPVLNPQLVAFSKPALEELMGVDVMKDVLGNPDQKRVAELFAGNALFFGAEPAAHCYCGHQFGGFAGQLGDGAAMYLGEITPSYDAKKLREEELAPKQHSALSTGGGGVLGGGGTGGKTSEDEENSTSEAMKQQQTLEGVKQREANALRVPYAGKPFIKESDLRSEFQFKGAGHTPYSRSADGRKVLRSSLREFTASEAMNALGIPTTRAATLVTSDSTVERDPMYTGKVIQERCTVVSRLAPTFLRFGSFQICNPPDPSTGASGPSFGYKGSLHLGGVLGTGGGGAGRDGSSSGAEGGGTSAAAGGGGGAGGGNEHVMIGQQRESEILHLLFEYTAEFFYPEIVAEVLEKNGHGNIPIRGLLPDKEAMKKNADAPIEKKGTGTKNSSSSSANARVGGAKRTMERQREVESRALKALEGETTPLQTFLYKHPQVKADLLVAVFEEVAKRTAELVAQWQCVGFCHGVLNTDNMSILGLTIDYGPYGFMTHFDENHICNTSDDSGRYSYRNQPEMCKWNLVQLAQAWSLMLQPSEMNEAFYLGQAAVAPNSASSSEPSSPLSSSIAMSSPKPLTTLTAKEVLGKIKDDTLYRFNQIISDKYDSWYEEKRTRILRHKLGLVAGLKDLDIATTKAENSDEEDEAALSGSGWNEKEVKRIIDMLFKTMQETGADFTNVFLHLRGIKLFEARELSSQLQSEVEEAQSKMVSTCINNLVASCAPLSSVKSKLLKKIQGLRSGMSPQQVMMLIQLSETEPQVLDQMFNAPREAVIEQLHAEAAKLQRRSELMEQHQALREKEAEIGVAQMEEELQQSNDKLWTDFVNHYYEMLQFKQHPDDDEGLQERRRRVAMDKSNPKFILRPWILRDVIDAAEGKAVGTGTTAVGSGCKMPGLGVGKPNFSVVQELLDRSLKPFEEDDRDGKLWGDSSAPEDASEICVSCSS